MARYCVLLQKFNFSTRQFFKILTVNFYCALTQNSLDPDNKTCTYMTIQSLSVMLNVSFFLFYHQNTLKLNVIYTFSISDFTFFFFVYLFKKMFSAQPHAQSTAENHCCLLAQYLLSSDDFTEWWLTFVIKMVNFFGKFLMILKKSNSSKRHNLWILLLSP